MVALLALGKLSIVINPLSQETIPLLGILDLKARDIVAISSSFVFNIIPDSSSTPVLAFLTVLKISSGILDKKYLTKDKA